MSVFLHTEKLMGQLLEVARQIHDEDFRKTLVILNGASIGKHFRHTIEFFQILAQAVPDGKINYDQRMHSELIESEVSVATNVLERLKGEFSVERADFSLMLETSYALKQDQNIQLTTSFYREIAYNLEHATHHMALMKIGIQEAFSYVRLPDHFGVASSTIRHENSH
jgi:hypothetical protein